MTYGQRNRHIPMLRCAWCDSPEDEAEQYVSSNDVAICRACITEAHEAFEKRAALTQEQSQ